MGCSNNSFEINTSKENAPEENQDDYIIGLMKRRLIIVLILQKNFYI